jgi:hypothetical protein
MVESTKKSADAGGIFEEYDLIHVYSRTDAIEDGMLLDVTTVAREMGFRYPTAITHAAWHDCVAWNDADSERKRIVQDENHRLRHVLARLLIAIRTSGFKDEDRIFFNVERVPCDGASKEPQALMLMSVCGPGDTAEPVITISFLGED